MVAFIGQRARERAYRFAIVKSGRLPPEEGTSPPGAINITLMDSYLGRIIGAVCVVCPSGCPSEFTGRGTLV